MSTVAPPAKKSNTCSLSRDSGPCEASINRWYFCYHDNICKQFQYGGCGGNDNNFLSKDDCEGMCMASTGDNPELLKIYMI